MKNERILKAYDFFVKKESKKESFHLREMADCIGWKPATIITYISKQSAKFIIKGSHDKFRLSQN